MSGKENLNQNTIKAHHVIVHTDYSVDGNQQWIEIGESKGKNGIYLPKTPLSPETIRKWDDHNKKHRELEIDDDHRVL